MIRPMVKIVSVAIITVFLVACVTTQGNNSGQSGSGQVAAGAVIGAVAGLVGCKFLNSDDCEKYALAGAVIGGGLAYLLNARQKAAYEAARNAQVNKVDIVKRVNEDGKEAADVVLLDEWYESPTSPELSPAGEDKLRQTFANMQTQLEEGEAKKVMEVSTTYVGESDASRLLAEKRAQNMRTALSESAPNVVFNARKIPNQSSDTSGQPIIIR